MKRGRKKAMLGTVLSSIGVFLMFFVVISFIVTCSFLVFGSSVALSEDDVRTFAPVVFVNIFILAALFSLFDLVRRRMTVDRPVKEMLRVLNELKVGNYEARITMPFILNKENRFREIAENINHLAGELSGVETLRTDFIANVSHEMKTPLAVMQNYGTMLGQPELDDAARIEYAKAVTDGSRRLTDLMTNILKLNRLENQQIYPQMTEFDLGEQLCECLLAYENVWEKSNIEIDTNIEENVTVKADAELLALVWNNLFSNAFKFTDPGGKVTVSLKGGDYYALVEVTDTGCGMSPEIGAHIFEKFYQGDSSHATAGNGLGLALVKRIMDITGGEISVVSELGVGSTFSVQLRRYPDGLSTSLNES